jgi:hypothetical protein
MRHGKEQHRFGGLASLKNHEFLKWNKSGSLKQGWQIGKTVTEFKVVAASKLATSRPMAKKGIGFCFLVSARQTDDLRRAESNPALNCSSNERRLSSLARDGERPVRTQEAQKGE